MDFALENALEDPTAAGRSGWISVLLRGFWRQSRLGLLPVGGREALRVFTYDWLIWVCFQLRRWLP